MLIRVHPKNPEKRIISKIVQDLKKGAIFVLPTDTVYAFCTNFHIKDSVRRLYQLKEIPPQKPLSLYCRDFSQASAYIRMDNNQIFRWMKKCLPGPYTLIFKATKKLPHFTLTRQKTVGIRIIDHPLIQGILAELDAPIIGTSVFLNDEYIIYPEELEKSYGKHVHAIIDGGPVELALSTILDAKNFPPTVLREGKGDPRIA